MIKNKMMDYVCLCMCLFVAIISSVNGAEMRILNLTLGKNGPLRYIALGILKRSDPPHYWQHYKVLRFISHPEYDPPQKYNDIALIQTDKEILFDLNVLPACLAHVPTAAARGVVVGWGAVGYRGELADTLQTARLDKVNKENCTKFFPPSRLLRAGFDASTQLCYNSQDEYYDTCQGDSGGPLETVGLEKQWCAAAVVGVTSYGRACGVMAQAGMYTRVHAYLPWVEDIEWP